MKKVIVKGHDWTETVMVDDTIFDDYMIEACTQALERKIKKGLLKITPLIQAWEENKSKKIKIPMYNTYKLLTNAGLYSKAELLRLFFLHETNIDLANEPMKA